MKKILYPITNSIQGEISIPGDKSISHRSIMFGSLAKGKTKITNFLPGEDCLCTIKIFQQLGVKITQEGTDAVVESEGANNLTEPKEPLYFGNSGTTARLMLGILAALPFHSVVYGDPHLTERPMDRVVVPLREMGAQIDGRNGGTLLPLAIRGRTLKAIKYDMPVNSAQVKSALLFAGLFADGQTVIKEKATSRNHTENMLKSYGAKVDIAKHEIAIEKSAALQAMDIHVPGDISSAAFFLVAAAIAPGSELALRNVGLNDTRTGIITVLENMGADLQIVNRQVINGENSGDIIIRHKQLKSTSISGDIIPALIDEIPVIALLATQANGTTIIADAEELRVKETDRIRAVAENLTALGAKVEEKEDGLIIYGQTDLTGGKIKGYSDHRMAMMGVIASLITKDPVEIDDVSSIAVSYPEFFNDLNSVIAQG